MTKKLTVTFSLSERERAFKKGLNDTGFTAEEITVLFNAVKDTHPNAFHTMTVDPHTKKIDFSGVMADLKKTPDVGDATKVILKNPGLLIEVMDPSW